MNDTLRRRYEMLLRVRDFGVQNSTDFPPGSRAQELFTELDSIIAEIETNATEQESSSRTSREGTANRGEARTDLREEMEAISDTARAMAMDTAGLEDKFRMPRGNVSDVDLITDARAFASDALPLKEQFIRNGLPPNFLEALTDRADLFERVIETQQRSRRLQVTATSMLDDAVERGVNKVRQLDAVVRNTYRNNATKTVEWESARHTRRAPSATEQPTTPPAP